MIFVCGISLVGITIQLLTLLYFANLILSNQPAGGHIISPALYQLVSDNSEKFIGIFSLGAFMFFLFSLLASLIYSHKIVGPIYRLTLYLTQMPSDVDNLPKLLFRKKDFFQEIPVKFNSFTEALTKKIKDSNMQWSKEEGQDPKKNN